MGRKRKRQITFGAINAVMPAPHTPERYIELLVEAEKQEINVELRGDWVGRIGNIRREEGPSGDEIVRGDFYKYVDLDTTKEWFNVQKQKPAEEKELKTINIPEHLKPHFQHLPFIFFPKKHRFIVVTKDGEDSISHNQIAAILKVTFTASDLIGKYGRVEVIIEPSREALEAIFSAPRLRGLEINIATPPNPDDFEEFERELFDDMDIQNMKEYNIGLKEKDGRGLIPSKRTKALAKVAQSNGDVTGRVGERGSTKKVSTSDHPLVEKSQYDPDAELRGEIVLSKAMEMLGKL